MNDQSATYTALQSDSEVVSKIIQTREIIDVTLRDSPIHSAAYERVAMCSDQQKGRRTMTILRAVRDVATLRMIDIRARVVIALMALAWFFNHMAGK